MKNPSPHNIQLEEEILASLVWRKEWIPEVLLDIEVHHFYISDHGKLFEVIKSMLSEGIVTPSLVTLQQANINLKLDIPASTVIGLTPGAAYSTLIELKENVKNLVRLWKLRMAIANTELVTEKARSLCEISEIAESLDEISIELMDDGSSTTGTIVSELVKDVTQEILDAHDPDKETEAGIETGYEFFDVSTRGLKDEEMVVIAARPGVGKSTIAMNIAEYVWANTNKRIVVFSLEMSEKQLMHRSISSQSRIPMSTIQSGNVKPTQMGALHDAIKSFKNNDSIIEDTPAITTSWMRSKLRYHNMKRKVDLVIIDYIQLMSPDDSRAQRTGQIGQISTDIKNTAKMFKLPIIAVAQLNRQSESRKDGVPKLSDLRESGQIEQDADTVMMLWRKDMQEAEQQDLDVVPVNCALVKNRHGPTGGFELKANLPIFKME